MPRESRTRPDQRQAMHRRTLMRIAGASGLAWLTPLAASLARAAESAPAGQPAESLIVLWMQGGPSQLETFDPHPGRRIAGGTGAIATTQNGVKLAEGMVHLAGEMDDVAIVRNVVSKEGDHERATYNVKTGYRPDPTLVHPSIGAVICHELPQGRAEIPRHISVLPGPWPARGGYLGDTYDAFQVYSLSGRLPDVSRHVPENRFQRRLEGLDVIDRAFARGRLAGLEERKTLHRATIDKAVAMMSSEQLEAFDVDLEPKSVRDEYGNTPFGRGCLAARRLIEVGVRCVEVTLDGWDSHVNNHEMQRERVAALDPAFAALVRDLRRRGLLHQTLVMCCGEFGRTPAINPAAGRDHWPHGFSVALAGGGIRGGAVVGTTDPEGGRLEYNESGKPGPRDGSKIDDVHATVLHALGVNFHKELMTRIGRPMRLSRGKIIPELLADKT
jgi:hypothetical protein